jgi:hypothetical protein
MLSFGGHRSCKLADNAFVDSINYMEAAMNHPECRKVLEHGLDSYIKYRHHEAGFW